MESPAIWRDGASEFMAVRHLSQERALHPAVLALIESSAGERLLDYGCGDGRILERLPQRWAIDAYDPSPQMREIAARRVGHRLDRLFSTPGEIAGVYDVVLLGMVILCIPEEAEFRRVFRECAGVMHDRSRLLITTTHPCFRNARFSNFHTSFGGRQPFAYMEEGQPFDVTLQDPGSEGITFTDFHWSLNFTVDALRQEGLKVNSLIEVPDDPASPHRNHLVPPYLIFDCVRAP